MRRNPVRYSRIKNPRIPSFVVWGGMGLLGYLLYKKVAKAAGAAIDSSNERASAGFGDLPPGKEYMRYRLIKRGSGSVCYDIETKQQVSADLCEREMLRGVSGIFG